MNYQQIHEQAIEIVRRTGQFIAGESQKFDTGSVKTKSVNQLVSYVDKTAEQMLVKELQALIPESGFITEEKTINKTGERWNWIIDPLDGTTNFIHKLPVYSVSVALQDRAETVIGIVYDICMNEMFTAYKGGKAYLNGKVINVSEVHALSASLLATGFPYYDYKQMSEYIEVLKYFMRNTHGLRRMGSAAIDLAYTACGRFDGFFEYGLHAWDVAGGAFIVKQAGGAVADFSGADDYIFGKTIIASNKLIADEFTNVIRKGFDKSI